MTTELKTERFIPQLIVSSVLRRATGTQHEKILAVLEYSRGAWVCGTAFMANYIPTYSQRIGEIIKQGGKIERGLCSNPGHKHKGTIGQYRWLPHRGERA